MVLARSDRRRYSQSASRLVLPSTPLDFLEGSTSAPRSLEQNLCKRKRISMLELHVAPAYDRICIRLPASPFA